MTRLIDLHCDWLLQYARETTVFDPELYEGVEARLGQTEGYLTGTSAAVLACYRRQEDWVKQVDPWRALGDLIARLEAEFPGRLLIGPEDFARWEDDADGLCWGVVGVEGFDTLIRTTADLDGLAGLFERGVRVFQPLYSAENALGGSSTPGDERGLTALGRSFLSALAELGTKDGPRSALDLAHLNPAAMSDVLDWFETNETPLVPVYSHGALFSNGFVSPRAITKENLGRLRALGGLTGFTPAFYEDGDGLKAAIEAAAELPFLGRAGFEGLALATDFLGVDHNPLGLGDVEGIMNWVRLAFPPETAAGLVGGNARALLSRLTGAEGSSSAEMAVRRVG
jgi:membrane dipeptidase